MRPPSTVKTISSYYVAFSSFLLLFVAFLMILYLGICAQNIKSQYSLCRLKETKQTLERTKLALKLELNRLSSLERIESIAKKELGMSHPPNRLIIDLRNPSVLQASMEETLAMNDGSLDNGAEEDIAE